jgi:hypothetical protein
VQDFLVGPHGLYHRPPVGIINVEHPELLVPLFRIDDIPKPIPGKLTETVTVFVV